MSDTREVILLVEIIANEGKYIELGRVGENARTIVKFAIREYLEEYPGAEFILLNKRPGDEDAYPVEETARDSEYLYWTVASSALAAQGHGLCELVVELGGVIAKSVVYGTRISMALGEGAEAPEVWQSWQQTMTAQSTAAAQAADDAGDAADRASGFAADAADSALSAAASAADAAASVRAVQEMGAEAETLGWEAQATVTKTVDQFTGAVTLTFGLPHGRDGAVGHDGVSPTFETEQIEGGYRLTITDAEGAHTVDLMDGEDGTDGVSPTIGTSEITGGHRLTITDKNGTSTVDVMDGQTGQTGRTGATGADGYSPTATVTKSGSTATISITDKNGTTTATVSDGAAGTTDYTGMTNKPQINSVTLSGDKSLSDLGIHGVPSGGAEDQVLAKNSGTDYDLKWVNQSGGDAHGIPSGGTANQVLAKTDGTDYNVQWKTNSLVNLSDTTVTASTPEGQILRRSWTGKWEGAYIRQSMGFFYDDGEGNIMFYWNNTEPAHGYTCYATDDESENADEYEFLWKNDEPDGNGDPYRRTFYFLGKTGSTPYNLNIRKFVGIYDDDYGDYTGYYEQTAPDTHEVSHTWVGTQAEYTALGTYDAHTIYYITQ